MPGEGGARDAQEVARAPVAELAASVARRPTRDVEAKHVLDRFARVPPFARAREGRTRLALDAPAEPREASALARWNGRLPRLARPRDEPRRWVARLARVAPARRHRERRERRVRSERVQLGARVPRLASRREVERDARARFALGTARRDEVEVVGEPRRRGAKQRRVRRREATRRAARSPRARRGGRASANIHGARGAKASHHGSSHSGRWNGVHDALRSHGADHSPLRARELVERPLVNRPRRHDRDPSMPPSPTFHPSRRRIDASWNCDDDVRVAPSSNATSSRARRALVCSSRTRSRARRAMRARNPRRSIQSRPSRPRSIARRGISSPGVKKQSSPSKPVGLEDRGAGRRRLLEEPARRAVTEPRHRGARDVEREARRAEEGGLFVRRDVATERDVRRPREAHRIERATDEERVTREATRRLEKQRLELRMAIGDVRAEVRAVAREVVATRHGPTRVGVDAPVERRDPPRAEARRELRERVAAREAQDEIERAQPVLVDVGPGAHRPRAARG